MNTSKEILEKLNGIEQLAETAFYSFTEENYNNSELDELSAKTVATEGYSDLISSIMEDSYGSVPIAVVIQIGDLYFKSVGEYTSYGANDFGPWFEVKKKLQKIIQVTYEPTSNTGV